MHARFRFPNPSPIPRLWYRRSIGTTGCPRRSRGFRKVSRKFSGVFWEVFGRFSQGFREGFRFQNIFVKGSGEPKPKNLINCCVPRGPPPHRAAEPGPPRSSQKLVRTIATGGRRPKNDGERTSERTNERTNKKLKLILAWLVV